MSKLKSVVRVVFTKENAMTIASAVIKGVIAGKANTSQRNRVRRRR